MKKLILAKLVIVELLLICVPVLFAQEHDRATALDKKVRAFLDSRPRQRQDGNVPEIDGKLFYDMIIKNKYTKALEIGTSTGHSAIWIAWALSKTGGKLITVEIDESRYKRALENFNKAGLSEYIDARLGDAHEIVPKLKGPFDFVFSDAETEWHKNYFEAVAPKLLVGGCYTAHDVSDTPVRYMKGIVRSLVKGRLSDLTNGAFDPAGPYVEYLKGLKNFETTFDDRGAGVSITCKKSEE